MANKQVWIRLISVFVIIVICYSIFYMIPVNNMKVKSNIILNEHGFVEVDVLGGSLSIKTEKDIFGNDFGSSSVYESERIIEFRRLDEGEPYVEKTYIAPFIRLRSNKGLSEAIEGAPRISKVIVYCDLRKTLFVDQTMKLYG